MTLKDLLASRLKWTEEDTIYVVQPWTCDAEAVLSNDVSEATIFQSGKRYDYFLEGFIARDFLDDLGASAADISEDACHRLICYARDDA